MTQEQIKKSIEKGRLQLVGWQKFTHYNIVVFFAFLPLLFAFMSLYDYIAGLQRHTVQGKIWFYILPIILCLTFYTLQYKKLRLTVIETTLNRPEILTIAEAILRDQKWELRRKSSTLFIAKTNPGFLSGSFGEQVTIIFSGKNILMNSICDPDKTSSVASYGNNKRNLKILIDGINKANKAALEREA